MAGEMVRIPDEDVQRLAKEHGPESVIARVWAELQAQRAKDRQVFAFRFGTYWVTGPEPDARTEADILDFGAEFDDVDEEV
jgi:hypothetical protein